MIIYVTIYLIIGIASTIYWLGHDNHVEKYISITDVLYYIISWPIGIWVKIEEVLKRKFKNPFYRR